MLWLTDHANAGSNWKGSVERIPSHRPWPLTLTFQNVISSSPVDNGTTDKVW